MDGSLSDQKIGGRLFRLVSLDYALLNFPPIIIDLATNHVTTLPIFQPSGPEMVVLKGASPIYPYSMLREDFDLCKEISLMFIPLMLFTSDTPQIIVNRIQAQIRLYFAGRQ